MFMSNAIVCVHDWVNAQGKEIKQITVDADFVQAFDTMFPCDTGRFSAC